MISESKTIFFKVKWHCSKWEGKDENEISFPCIYIFSEGANFADDFDGSFPFLHEMALGTDISGVPQTSWEMWIFFKAGCFPGRNACCSMSKPNSQI